MTTTATRTAAVAIATALALTACTTTDDPPTSTTTTSEPTPSTTTADYKDEAIAAARAWIEDDAGKPSETNATPEALETMRAEDAALKKAGVRYSGHDSVVSTEINKGLTNPTDVVIDVCVTTDQRWMKDGKNVRTDPTGKPVQPGDRQMQTVEMHRDVGAKDWLVASSRVRETSC